MQSNFNVAVSVVDWSRNDVLQVPGSAFLPTWSIKEIIHQCCSYGREQIHTLPTIINCGQTPIVGAVGSILVMTRHVFAFYDYLYPIILSCDCEVHLVSYIFWKSNRTKDILADSKIIRTREMGRTGYAEISSPKKTCGGRVSIQSFACRPLFSHKHCLFRENPCSHIYCISLHVFDRNPDTSSRINYQSLKSTFGNDSAQ